MDLREEEILGSNIGEHWYYQAKKAALMRYIQHLEPRVILDVGAGSGFFSRALLCSKTVQEAICVDTGYWSEHKELVSGKPIRFCSSCGKVDANLVLLMDVLEHVDDDAMLLQEYIGKVPGGACFLVTVPAFSFLWSGHDVYLGHKRRYTLSALERLVHNAGLKVERISYYYGLVFPLAVAIRYFNRLLRGANDLPRSHLKQHSALVNRFLAGVCAAELPLIDLNRLAGLTVFCLARKL